jgi:hypothetical protein
MGISKFGENVSTCVAVFDDEERVQKVKKDSKIEKNKKLDSDTDILASQPWYAPLRILTDKPW